MTGPTVATANVLLLRYVDFTRMDVRAAASFRQKMERAGKEELAQALQQLFVQTKGVITDRWVTDIAIALMESQGLYYTVNRIDLTTKEVINVRQNG